MTWAQLQDRYRRAELRKEKMFLVWALEAPPHSSYPGSLTLHCTGAVSAAADKGRRNSEPAAWYTFDHVYKQFSTDSTVAGITSQRGGRDTWDSTVGEVVN